MLSNRHKTNEAYTESEWLDTFADNLADYLKSKGISQEEFADKAGLTPSSVSRYLNKQRMPTVRAVINMFYALDAEVNSLDDFIDFGGRIKG